MRCNTYFSYQIKNFTKIFLRSYRPITVHMRSYRSATVHMRSYRRVTVRMRSYRPVTTFATFLFMPYAEGNLGIQRRAGNGQII